MKPGYNVDLAKDYTGDGSTSRLTIAVLRFMLHAAYAIGHLANGNRAEYQRVLTIREDVKDFLAERLEQVEPV